MACIVTLGAQVCQYSGKNDVKCLNIAAVTGVSQGKDACPARSAMYQD